MLFDAQTTQTEEETKKKKKTSRHAPHKKKKKYATKTRRNPHEYCDDDVFVVQHQHRGGGGATESERALVQKSEVGVGISSSRVLFTRVYACESNGRKKTKTFFLLRAFSFVLVSLNLLCATNDRMIEEEDDLEDDLDDEFKLESDEEDEVMGSGEEDVEEHSD